MNLFKIEPRFLLDKRWLFRAVLAVFLAIIVLGFFSYFNALKSDSYQVALQSVKSSDEVLAEFGMIKKARLSYVNYYTKISGTWGEAFYPIVIEGARKKGEVTVKLQIRKGKWEVESINIPL